MNKTFLSILLIIFITIGGYLLLNSNNDDILTFNVAPETKPCVGVGPMDCMIVNGEFFYEQIEGFTFEPGYMYVLKVRQTERDNVPADANKYVYTLVEEVSKTPADGRQVEAIVPRLRFSPQGTTWQYNGGTLAFDDEDGYVMDFGCNVIRGTYSTDRTILTFTPPVSTKKGCPSEITQKEKRFVNTITRMELFEERPRGAAALIGNENEMLLLPLAE